MLFNKDVLDEIYYLEISKYLKKGKSKKYKVMY